MSWFRALIRTFALLTAVVVLGVLALPIASAMPAPGGAQAHTYTHDSPPPMLRHSGSTAEGSAARMGLLHG